FMLIDADYKPSPEEEEGGRAGKELSFGLCLSGGGFRATLFHLGVMRALHKVGLLERVDAISAVSGGSIFAAAYGLAVARAERAGTPFDFESFALSIVRCASRGIRNRVLLKLASPLFLYRWAFRRETRTTLLADDDADWIRELAMKKGAWANIPPKSNRSDPICFSPYLYRARNQVERFFNRIKQCRRVATRYDRLASNYLAFVQLASIRLWLRLNEPPSYLTCVRFVPDPPANPPPAPAPVC